MKKWYFLFGALVLAVGCGGCAAPRIALFSDASDPLREVTLEGTGTDRVVVIPIAGILTDAPKGRLLGTRPSIVQEVVAHLRLAEKDQRVKGVLLKVDSPGGTITASDILYHEITAFKGRTGRPVVVCMMGLATSGGYYVSLPADVIVAHPTTITGSIGVILARPEVVGLMEKLGVGVRVNKSGENKDMGAPYRTVTASEQAMLQEVTDHLGRRFLDLVRTHRRLDAGRLAEIGGGRVYLADRALEAGLVDRIGYLQDALDEARRLAGLTADSRVVAYRRTAYPDDNLYNIQTRGLPDPATPLLDLGILSGLLDLEPGFYHIWPQFLGTP